MSRERTGLWERFLLSVMGPPQVGDLHAPPSYVPDASVHLCHRCGRDWDAHEIVRTASRTQATCPAPATPRPAAGEDGA